MGKSALNEIYWPLMDAESVKLPYCAVCGRTWPLNEHHIVWRGWGNLLDEGGRKRPKPTVTLCGNGNNLRDADGVMLCHGKAHWNYLHFRNDRGRLECIELPEPTKYQEALAMAGWRPVPCDAFTAARARLIASGMGGREAIRELGIDEFG